MTLQEQVEQKNEYERRKKAGQNPEPLVERVDLAELAGEQRYQNAIDCENIQAICSAVIRGHELTYYTPSRRLLWQALGLEYIEPELLDFIDKMPDDSVYFDVGASNGLFAVYAAKTNKKTYCFEPESSNYFLLSYNSYLNRSSFRHALKFFNVALFDSSGVGSIYMEKFEVGGHLKILDKAVKRGEKTFIPEFVQPTLKYTLDDFIAFTGSEKPEYIKIDVDGTDMQVLYGMKKTLEYPGLKKIYIELEESGPKFQQCKTYLEQYGFRVEFHKRLQNYFGEENYIFSR